MKHNEFGYDYDTVKVKVVEQAHGTTFHQDVSHVQITPRWNGDSGSDDDPHYKMKVEL